MGNYNPTVDECIAQWQHNRLLLSKLDPEFSDWIVTATFYTALHAVESLLLADAVKADHATHGSRAIVLHNNRKYNETIWPAYKVAYDLAHVARYSAKPRRWMKADNIPLLLFQRSLYPIEAEVLKWLRALKVPPTCPDCPPVTLKPATPA